MRQPSATSGQLRPLPWKGSALNSVQRRLLRAFFESGGDLNDDAAVGELLRYVEATFFILPPKTRIAVEAVWRQPQPDPYAALAVTLSRQEGLAVSLEATRQRVSRGVRIVEEAIRRRPWHAVSRDRDRAAIASFARLHRHAR